MIKGVAGRHSRRGQVAGRGGSDHKHPEARRDQNLGFDGGQN